MTALVKNTFIFKVLSHRHCTCVLNLMRTMYWLGVASRITFKCCTHGL